MIALFKQVENNPFSFSLFFLGLEKYTEFLKKMSELILNEMPKAE